MKAMLALFLFFIIFPLSVYASPPNSHTMGGMWFCNEGFKRVGDSCERLSVPRNAHVMGNMWFCNEGFKRVGNSCERFSVPGNAHVMGNMWFCNEGFKRVGNSCERLSVPENAHVMGSMWFCNEGYKKVGSRCQEMSAREVEERERLLELVAQRQAELRANGASGQSCQTEYDSGAAVCISVNMANLDCDESSDGGFYDSCEVDMDYSLETDYRGGSSINVDVYCEAEISYKSKSGRNRYDSDGYHDFQHLGSYGTGSGYISMDFSFSSYEEVFKVSLKDAWCEMQSVYLH
ncbi:hypothetical protein [uncultured Halomonas sp.]|uniref:hypothetical protein n=1 Tax=uncultured Halomonas sp. TaxID=173971 RepID=UPI002609E569|nr:hypothetical protein [uncultured Halomonas sp.]